MSDEIMPGVQPFAPPRRPVTSLSENRFRPYTRRINDIQAILRTKGIRMDFLGKAADAASTRPLRPTGLFTAGAMRLTFGFKKKKLMEQPAGE